MNRHIQKLGKFATACTMAIAFGTAAHAAPTSLVAVGNTNPPIGHFEFCKTYPNECTSLGRDRGPMPLTRDRWATMLEINTRVNQSIKPDTDLNIFGVEELWAYPRSVGDCEDYVLLKRHMLIEKGFSPSDLLIVRCCCCRRRFPGSVRRSPQIPNAQVTHLSSRRGDCACAVV